MQTVVLTCTTCGKSETVPRDPDHIRGRRCKFCNQPLVEKRSPGTTQASENPEK
jgi:RNase P subunit RPR2